MILWYHGCVSLLKHGLSTYGNLAEGHANIQVAWSERKHGLDQFRVTAIRNVGVLIDANPGSGGFV